jgi:hypothetical protein
MAIAKKTRDILLPTLRIHREHASSHLGGSIASQTVKITNPGEKQTEDYITGSFG